jgi:hypothetical protein
MEMDEFIEEIKRLVPTPFRHFDMMLVILTWY